ncbi:hypothetical protein E2562_016951, partial [Oryza meyeriana var. granulata]
MAVTPGSASACVGVSRHRPSPISPCFLRSPERREIPAARLVTPDHEAMARDGGKSSAEEEGRNGCGKRYSREAIWA